MADLLFVAPAVIIVCIAVALTLRARSGRDDDLGEVPHADWLRVASEADAAHRVTDAPASDVPLSPVGSEHSLGARMRTATDTNAHGIGDSGDADDDVLDLRDGATSDPAPRATARVVVTRRRRRPLVAQR